MTKAPTQAMRGMALALALALLPAPAVAHGDAAPQPIDTKGLPELGDDLLRLVLFLGHSCILQMAQKPYLREDHFSGGRPE